MKHLRSAALSSFIAAGVLLSFAAVAEANRVSLASTHSTTAISTNWQLTILAGVGPVVMRASAVRMALTYGAGTYDDQLLGARTSVPPGAVSITGMTLTRIAATVTQPALWSVALSSLLNAARTASTGILFRFLFPPDSIRIVVPGNDFYIGRGVASALATTASTALGARATVSSRGFANQLPTLGLVISRVAVTNLGLRVGTPVGFTGVYSYSPGIVASPVL